MLLNKLCSSQFRNGILRLTSSMRSLSVSTQLSSKITPEVVAAKKDLTTEGISNQKIIDRVNQQVISREEGRLFAVVHLCGKQFKVTSGDIIVVEGEWPPDAGDRVRLDKVLIVGGKDFSLIGRPIVQKDLVDVQATIIEKTLSHTRTHFRKRRRKQYQRINFARSSNTMIRINSIDIKGRVNEDIKPEPDIPRIF
ncbi:39S ribosomal protein L21, mitochondrial [Lutzomyia longipalpis]|uniref:39S ribosomal protein L21, mitochondrial n=1 Tax=Lutzomyia longipalpis TaxID=7200 RepID=UPI0024833DCD|nr:39S ribosomal protein L21, mitochondrial [Lutzomyia longipalpis]